MTISIGKVLALSIAGALACSTALAAPDTAQAPMAAKLMAAKSMKAKPMEAKQVGDFALLDQNGEFHQLTRYKHKKALVVMAYDAACPSDAQALADYNRARQAFEPKDVSFVLLNSTANQDRNAVREAAQKANVEIPILMDHAHLVAESLGMARSGSVRNPRHVGH